MARPLTESFPANEMLNKTSFGLPKERPARKSDKGTYSNFFHISALTTSNSECDV
jgi:hypothetical protein